MTESKLPQERLSEEDMKQAQHYLQNNFELTFTKNYGAKLINEIIHLKSLEAALTEIATSTDPFYIWTTSHQQYARNVLNIGDDEE